MASEYTPNRRYPLYTDLDKPNLRDQYNQAVREIDADMEHSLDNSQDVSDKLGSGFDAQHTVTMAIEEIEENIGSGFEPPNTIAAQIQAEKTARENADTSLGTRITNETQARENADTALGTRITNETQARENADTELSTAINTEKTNRENADTALGTALTTEATNRENADTALSTAINNEKTARESADNQINDRIDALTKDEYLVIIGDSYSDPNDGSAVDVEWWNVVADYYGYKVINVAIGGAGFFKNGYTGQDKFSTQITKAAAQASGKKVSMVILFGGMNDVGDVSITPGNLLDEVRSCVVSMANNFPDAKILVAGIAPHYNFDSYGNNNHQWDNGRIAEMTAYMCYAVSSFSNTSKRGVNFIDFSKVGPFITDYFVSDTNFHPTIHGHRQIAFRMLGGSLDNDRQSMSHITGDHRPTLSNGTDTVYGTCECKQVGPNMVSIQSTFPAIASSGNMTMKLNGLPVGPAYILAIHNNSGLVSGAYATSRYSKNYTVPLRNSSMQASSTWSISYLVEV